MDAAQHYGGAAQNPTIQGLFDQVGNLVPAGTYPLVPTIHPFDSGPAGSLGWVGARTGGAPPAQTACIFDGCTRPVWVDPEPPYRRHVYCGRTHARDHLALTGGSPDDRPVRVPGPPLGLPPRIFERDGNMPPPDRDGESLFRFVPELGQFSLAADQVDPKILQTVELLDRREIFYDPSGATETFVVPYTRKYKPNSLPGNARLGLKTARELLNGFAPVVAEVGSVTAAFVQLATKQNRWLNGRNYIPVSQQQARQLWLAMLVDLLSQADVCEATPFAMRSVEGPTAKVLLYEQSCARWFWGSPEGPNRKSWGLDPRLQPILGEEYATIVGAIATFRTIRAAGGAVYSPPCPGGTPRSCAGEPLGSGRPHPPARARSGGRSPGGPARRRGAGRREGWRGPWQGRW